MVALFVSRFLFVGVSSCFAMTAVMCSVFGQLPAEHDQLRLNELQIIGSHNSYHVAPEPELMRFIELGGKRVAESIDYTHPTLTDQLNQGIRQFELDVYADPEGGLFANPLGLQMLRDAGKEPQYVPNRDGKLLKPGLKIIHDPNFDYATRNETFLDALQEIDRWSQENSDHVPIFVLVELKEKAAVASALKLVPFDRAQLLGVDAEIRAGIATERLLTPDDFRGRHTSLRDAIRMNGWPRLRDCRGKIFFALDNEGAVRDRYLEDNPSLEGRAMLASVGPDHPAAAFRKLNDPFGQFDEIRQSVEQGLLVRTRTDASTFQARKNDKTQRDKAIASGAQFVSTDYWNADPRFSDYQVRFENDKFVRINPNVSLTE